MSPFPPPADRPTLGGPAAAAAMGSRSPAAPSRQSFSTSNPDAAACYRVAAEAACRAPASALAFLERALALVVVGHRQRDGDAADREPCTDQTEQSTAEEHGRELRNVLDADARTQSTKNFGTTVSWPCSRARATAPSSPANHHRVACGRPSATADPRPWKETNVWLQTTATAIVSLRPHRGHPPWCRSLDPLRKESWRRPRALGRRRRRARRWCR